MEKKIYCVGIEEGNEAAINGAVSGVAGVSSCVTSSAKCQVLVNFDESVAGIEAAINAAISSCGVEVL